MASLQLSEVRRENGNAVIHVRFHFAAPRAKVFGFFADHAKLSQLFGSRIERVVDAPEGDDPNGLGSVRRIHMPPTPAFEERIERFEANDLIEYTITGGSPVKNHYGWMRFEDADGGTLLDYRIRLAGRIPGSTGLIAGMMRRTLAKGLPAVARTLEAA